VETSDPLDLKPFYFFSEKFMGKVTTIVISPGEIPVDIRRSFYVSVVYPKSRDYELFACTYIKDKAEFYVRKGLHVWYVTVQGDKRLERKYTNVNGCCPELIFDPSDCAFFHETIRDLVIGSRFLMQNYPLLVRPPFSMK